MSNASKLTSFKDLEVYQNSYQNMLKLIKFVLPKLPPNERYDLKDQLSRSSKAIPRLIAEGYAKRHQRAGFQKYLDDAMAESNETVVGLSQIKDLYPGCVDIDMELLIDQYDKVGRQLYKLSMAWSKFKSKHR